MVKRSGGSNPSLSSIKLPIDKLYSLEQLDIVYDAAMLELATWDGVNKKDRESAIKKILWVEAREDEISITRDICLACYGDGCEMCNNQGYLKLDKEDSI